jgi:hypothetical protein
MHLALALCLAASLPADAPAADNLDFHTGTLDGWEGESFAIAPVGHHGRRLIVSERSNGPPGNPGGIHRLFSCEASRTPLA